MIDATVAAVAAEKDGTRRLDPPTPAELESALRSWVIGALVCLREWANLGKQRGAVPTPRSRKLQPDEGTGKVIELGLVH